MSILADYQIKQRCEEGEQVRTTPLLKMIDPFVEKLTEKDVISYGLSSFGYDIRCSEDFRLFTNEHTTVVDPKNPEPENFHRLQIIKGERGNFVVLPPNSYALTCSVETLYMPMDVLGLCIGKSSYARCGIIVNVTPLEPGWRGQITIEVANTSNLPARVYVNEGIMQVLFFHHESGPSVAYNQRQGKYQDQKGVTIARVRE